MRSLPADASLQRTIARKNSCQTGLSAASPSLPSTKQRSTVIRFFVSVPVLSEQTTLTAPSVSTHGSRRTMVLTFTIRVTLRARQSVTTAGSPSGTAATAREIAVRSISNTSRFCHTAIPNNTMQMPRERMLNSFPSSPSRFCRGVISSLLSLIMAAILPICVSMPVAVTTPFARPAVTIVDINAMFF